MKVILSGPLGGQLDTGLQSSALVIIKFFAKKLNIHRLHTKIEVRFHHRLSVDNSHSEGLCESLGSRNFIIDVALYGNWMSTLAQELVHVKQFARKELTENLQYWKGNDHSDTDYWDQPWEKEARRLQKKMMIEYMSEFE